VGIPQGNREETVIYDCLVIGAGPAGLSAALLLGRTRRRVLVCDSGAGRNRAAVEMHGYLTRDGMSPADFRAAGRKELQRYETVEVRDALVTGAEAVDGGFEITLEGGERRRGRTLLLCTGVVDAVPEIDGIAELYGTSVHHCPFCDGWEHRDEPIAVHGCDESAGAYALGMLRWSRDLVLCTDGAHALSADDKASLARHGVRVREERVLRLEGRGGRLERIIFADGPPLARTALFFCAGQRQHSDFAARIGARFTDKGVVDTKGAERTTVPGLWVAGDASKDAQLVIVAAAEGAAAAVSINTWLTRAELA
jgi:thioredoxin reductase